MKNILYMTIDITIDIANIYIITGIITIYFVKKVAHRLTDFVASPEMHVRVCFEG